MIISLILNIFAIGFTVVQSSEINRLGQENLKLAEENQRLYNESLRAYLNIFVEPIANQNWTFTTEGAYFEIQVTLYNDGARATEIRRAELTLNFTADDGWTYSRTNPVNMTSDSTMIGYALEKGAYRVGTIRDFIKKETIEFPSLEIGVAKPRDMELTIWYFDNIDEEVSYGEAH
jgi:hypothetical protein